jgi:hypothetical protein
MTFIPGPEWDDLEGALNKFSAIAMPLASQAIGRLIALAAGEMKVRPPQPDRDRANPGNKPSPYNTYVRGIGHFPRSAFNGTQRKSKGAYKPGPKGGKVRYTSQKMAQKFRMSVTASDTEVTGTLTNEATYSGLVLGHKPDSGLEPVQAAPHQQTGWPNVEDMEAKMKPIMDQEFDQVITQVIKQLSG